MGLFKSTGLKLCLGLRKKEKERAVVYCAINTHQDLISNTQAVFCSCLKSQIVSLGSSGDFPRLPLSTELVMACCLSYDVVCLMKFYPVFLPVAFLCHAFLTRFKWDHKLFSEFQVAAIKSCDPYKFLVFQPVAIC